MFEYMSAGNHHHQAFKSHRLVGISGNVVTIAAELFSPDGSTFQTTITHRLNAPESIEVSMSGGVFSEARFTHFYTAPGDKTEVDLAGDFPVLPGMTEADELNLIEGFFTMLYAEDAATFKSRTAEAVTN